MSNDELEHYGVKGMKWGRKKSDLKGQSFGETKVYETHAWIAANYQDIANQYAESMKRTLGYIQNPPDSNCMLKLSVNCR